MERLAIFRILEQTLASGQIGGVAQGAVARRLVALGRIAAETGDAKLVVARRPRRARAVGQRRQELRLRAAVARRVGAHFLDLPRVQLLSAAVQINKFKLKSHSEIPS